MLYVPIELNIPQACLSFSILVILKHPASEMSNLKKNGFIQYKLGAPLHICMIQSIASQQECFHLCCVHRNNFDPLFPMYCYSTLTLDPQKAFLSTGFNFQLCLKKNTMAISFTFCLLQEGLFCLVVCGFFFLVSALGYLVLLMLQNWCEVQPLVWLWFDGGHNVKHERCNETVSSY